MLEPLRLPTIEYLSMEDFGMRISFWMWGLSVALLWILIASNSSAYGASPCAGGCCDCLGGNSLAAPAGACSGQSLSPGCCTERPSVCDSIWAGYCKEVECRNERKARRLATPVSIGISLPIPRLLCLSPCQCATTGSSCTYSSPEPEPIEAAPTPIEANEPEQKDEEPLAPVPNDIDSADLPDNPIMSYGDPTAA